MARISIRSGDTDFTPNEGYTAGSQSIQFGGVAMRQACADRAEQPDRHQGEGERGDPQPAPW